MPTLHAISESPITTVLLAQLVVAFVVVRLHNIYQDWKWKRNHPFIPRSHGMNAAQMQSLVRSEGRLHRGEAERHAFAPRQDDPLRCRNCDGVFV